MKLPNGYVSVVFGDENGSLVASEGKGKNAVVVRELTNVVVPFPVTEDALEAACDTTEFVLTDVDGNEHALSGIHAAAAQRYKHAMETIRGMVRARTKTGAFKYSEKRIREYAESFTKIAGRERIGSSGIDANDLLKRIDSGALVDMDAVKAFLLAQAQNA